jgi:hypothetical protein
MAMPGFEVTEIAPWHEGRERGRGLRARFPDVIASHSPAQDFYFGDDGLLRRHDSTSMWRAGFRRRNMSTPYWRWTGSTFRRNDGPTGVGLICRRAATG